MSHFHCFYYGMMADNLRQHLWSHRSLRALVLVALVASKVECGTFSEVISSHHRRFRKVDDDGANI